MNHSESFSHYQTRKSKSTYLNNECYQHQLQSRDKIGSLKQNASPVKHYDSKTSNQQSKHKHYSISNLAHGK